VPPLTVRLGTLGRVCAERSTEAKANRQAQAQTEAEAEHTAQGQPEVGFGEERFFEALFKTAGP
jgi:hypothetical protein